MKGFYPKRPVKSFQDLEVYQRALAVSVAVVKRCVFKGKDEIKALIATELAHRVLKIPLLIAEAHSCRFADQGKALAILEDAMRNTNLAVVYLEQYRDIVNADIETEFFDEQIKNLLAVRQKTLYLQRSWRKFITNT